MDSKEIELEVEGMTCTNCALAVEKLLQKNSCENIKVNFATNEVKFSNPNKDVNEIISGIESLGYKVIKDADKNQKKKFNYNSLSFKLIISSIFTLPLLLHMIMDWHVLHNPLFQLIICSPVFYIGLQHFGKSAFKSLGTGAPNMDVLIFLGSTAAYLYSLIGIFAYPENAHDYLFFETCATIITLVLLGNFIEERSVKQTTKALKDLIALKPTKIKKIISLKPIDFIEVPEDEIKIGDQIWLNSGDRIAIDGIIEEGELELDESAISGESLPVFKNKNQTVISGSLVKNGRAIIKAQKVGKETTLAGIINLVKDAQSKKPSIQKLGDKVSAIFVPVVVLISILTFSINYFMGVELGQSIMRSIAVLVISCPCAMGLATPTAIMVGLGKAAKNGILIKGADTTEALANINTIVFDKTGTLTDGKFIISDFETYLFEDFVAKNLIYHLEKFSNHPIALTITNKYKDWYSMPLSFEFVNEIKGKGLSARDHGSNEYFLGKSNYFDENLIPQGDKKDIYLSYNNRIIAGFNIEDSIKEGAAELIQYLKNENIKVILLSGDEEKKCAALAKKLSINEYYSEQLPEQKLEKIKNWSHQNSVAMVGDGINDAPALSLAKVGISLGDATSIAKESAQIILPGNDLRILKSGIQLGKRTYKTIKQNLFWALFYNVIAIPLAGLGFLSPALSAFSMAFSDVIVIGNSLRLNLFKIKKAA